MIVLQFSIARVLRSVLATTFRVRRGRERDRKRCRSSNSSSAVLDLFFNNAGMNDDDCGSVACSDITNDQLGISGETGHGGANLRVY